MKRSMRGFLTCLIIVLMFLFAPAMANATDPGGGEGAVTIEQGATGGFAVWADGKLYIGADLSEVCTNLALIFNVEPVAKSSPGYNPDFDQSLYPKDTTPDPEPVTEEATYLKGPEGPQWGIPGELQKPPYTNVPRYQVKPTEDPPDGYVWTDHIWGWYARKIE